MRVETQARKLASVWNDRRYVHPDLRGLCADDIPLAEKIILLDAAGIPHPDGYLQLEKRNVSIDGGFCVLLDCAKALPVWDEVNKTEVAGDES